MAILNSSNSTTKARYCSKTATMQKKKCGTWFFTVMTIYPIWKNKHLSSRLLRVCQGESHLASGEGNYFLLRREA